MIELKNSKTTFLGRAPDGRNRFAIDSSIGAIQMRESGGQWQDIQPQIVRDTDGFHVEGTPYAVKMSADGDRTIYPDKTDLSKLLYLPVPAFIKSLPKRIEGNRIIASAPKFDVILQFTNTAVQFQVLLREPVAFDRITFDVDFLGLDILKLLQSRTGLGIPRPRLIDSRLRQAGVDLDKHLDWSYQNGQLQLGFDLTGLIFPVLLRNTTIDVEVGVGAGDGYGRQDGSSFSSSSTDNYVGYTSAQFMSFMRYTGFAGIFGNTIDVAYTKINGRSGSSAPAYTKLSLNDIDDPTAPTSGADMAGRASTTAQVDYDPTAVGWLINSYNQSPSLVTPLQEIADSWDTDSILVLLKDDGGGASDYLIWHSYEVGNPYEPQFHCEYSASGTTHQLAGVIAGAASVSGILSVVSLIEENNQDFYEAYDGDTLLERSTITSQDASQRAITLNNMKTEHPSMSYFLHEHKHGNHAPCVKTVV